jgi:hypothetical protein
MTGVTTDRTYNGLTPDNLRRHHIIRVPQRHVARLKVYLLNISNNGMMAEYRVRIGEFRVYVKVLNLDFKTRKERGISSYDDFDGILEKNDVTQEFRVILQMRYITR